jgi:hypothetical protein
VNDDFDWDYADWHWPKGGLDWPKTIALLVAAIFLCVFFYGVLELILLLAG